MLGAETGLRQASAGRRCARPLHPGQAVQSDQLDQGSDLGLSSAEHDRPSVGPEATGQHGQIEHQ